MKNEDIKDYSAPIAFVSYEDIKDTIEDNKLMSKKEEEKFLKSLDKADIDYIAGKVGDSVMETYWLALADSIEDYKSFKEK